jgi:hypothetical protein
VNFSNPVPGTLASAGALTSSIGMQPWYVVAELAQDGLSFASEDKGLTLLD